MTSQLELLSTFKLSVSTSGAVTLHVTGSLFVTMGT